MKIPIPKPGDTVWIVDRSVQLAPLLCCVERVSDFAAWVVVRHACGGTSCPPERVYPNERDAWDVAIEALEEDLAAMKEQRDALPTWR